MKTLIHKHAWWVWVLLVIGAWGVIVFAAPRTTQPAPVAEQIRFQK